jgi:hypothetical protein
MTEVPANPVVSSLFDRLGGQLAALASSEQATSEQLKAAAESTTNEQTKQATEAAAAQYAARARQASELAGTVSALRDHVLSDLDGLLALAARAM